MREAMMRQREYDDEAQTTRGDDEADRVRHLSPYRNDISLSTRLGKSV
jgi:hypothetical protein